MLKRLFIGLMILSALTAEGIVNEPWNIYNLCLYVYNNSGFLDNAGRSQESTDFVLTSDTVLFDSSLENKLFLESNIVEQLKINTSFEPKLRENLSTACIRDSYKGAGDDFSYSFISYISSSCPAPDKDIIINQADVSPPSSSLL